MENGRSNSSKFTCYFCNKTIENETETGHTSMCSQVLISCPYKCGSYVPRINLNKHKNECVNRINKTTVPSRQTQQTSPYGTIMTPNNSASLDRSVRNQTQVFQEQLSKLSKRLAECEKRYSEKVQALSQNNTNSSPAVEKLTKGHVQQSLEIETLKYQNLILTEWKRHVDFEVQSLGVALGSLQKNTKESEMQLAHMQERLILFEKLQIDLNFLRESFYKEQNESRKANAEFTQKLEALSDTITQENASIGALWNDHNLALDTLKHELGAIKQILDEQKAKHASFVFDLRAVSQIASEAAEKIEIQEREFNVMKRDFNQVKMDLEILESLSASDANGMLGGIMWRIDGVENKIKRAKENDVVLKSPVFYTHQYGYKIKILLFLNGLKKWKNRYALVCIHVLKGDYDLLLKWPCHIEGIIVLKDLENQENPKDFSKFITAKRKSGGEESEEPQESSSTYIFIPHTVLLKEKYLNNDTIFLEIKIKNPVKLETNL